MTLAYDVIFLGTPVWSGHIPRPMATFLKHNNTQGKTIVVMNIHLGSCFGSTINDIKKLCPNAKVIAGISVRASNDNQSVKQKTLEWLTAHSFSHNTQ